MRWVGLLMGLWLSCGWVLAYRTQVGIQRNRVPGFYRAFQVKEDQERSVRVVLRNGLTVLVEERSLRPLVAVVSYFRVGGRNSADALRAARWIEGQVEAERTIESLGGTLDLEVSNSATIFTSLVPAEKVAEALQVHADLVRPAKVQSPSGNEIHQLDSPSSPVSSELPGQNQLWNLAYGPVSERIPVVDPKAFQRDHYRPGNLILSIVGSVFKEEVLKQVVERYAAFAADGAANRVSSATTVSGEDFRYRSTRGPVRNTYLLFGFRIPSLSHPDYLALQALASALGRRPGSLLDRPLSPEIVWLESWAGLRSGPEGSLLEIALVPSPDKIDTAEVRLLGLLAALGREPLPRAEINRLQHLLLMDHFQRVESIRHRARLMAAYEERGSYLELERVPQSIAGLSADKLKQVAQRYLQRSNLSLIEYRPEVSEPRNFDAQTLGETLELLVPLAADKAIIELAAFEAGETPAFAPPSFSPSFFDYGLKATSVLRGPRIFLEEDHAVPLIHLAFYFNGGRPQEAIANAGITELLLRSWLGSLADAGGTTFWRDLTANGTRIEVVNEPDFFGLQLTFFSGQLRDTIAQALRWWRSVSLNPKIIAREKLRLRVLRNLEQDRTATRLRLAVRGEIFENHSYGRSRYGTDVVLDQITDEQLGEWATRQIGGFHPLILMRGDFAGTSFLPELIPVMSNSRYRKKQAVKQALKPTNTMAFASDTEESFLLSAHAGPGIGRRDDWILDILEQLVASRLKQLSADSGLSNLKLGHQAFLNGGAVFLSSRFIGSRQEARQQLIRVLTEFKQGGIPESDFLSAIVSTITKFYAEEEEGRRYLLKLARPLMAGEGAGYRTEYLATVKGIEVEELRDAISRLLPSVAATENSLSDDGSRSP